MQGCSFRALLLRTLPQVNADLDPDLVQWEKTMEEIIDALWGVGFRV